MTRLLPALWAHRGFIVGSIRREFQAGYRNSLLGAAWTLLNPLAMVVVYTVVFSQIMQARLPGVGDSFAYGIYLCAGIFSWTLFADITGRCRDIFLANANLLKKLNFPRLSLPLIVAGSALLNFAIIFTLLLVLIPLLTGGFPGWPLVGLLPVLLVQVALALGLGITVGVLNVFFRDVGQFFTILLQFWFWLTPIVYPLSIIPEKYRWVFAFNPLTSLIGAHQRVLVYGSWPEWSTMLPALGAALLFCVMGFYLFRRHAGEMVDEL